MMRKKQFLIKQKDCYSTHGGSGYINGSYWDGYDIICIACGKRIKNPPPHRWDRPLPFWKALKEWISGKPTFITKEYWEEYLRGVRGRKYE